MRFGVAQIAALDGGSFLGYNFEFNFTRITLTIRRSIGNGHRHHDALIWCSTNQRETRLNGRIGCKNNQLAILVPRDSGRFYISYCSIKLSQPDISSPGSTLTISSFALPFNFLRPYAC